MPAWLKSKQVLFVLLLVVVVGCGLAFSSALSTVRVDAQDKSPDSSGRSKGPGSVVALGRIEPVSEIINLGSGISPDRLETLVVARGDMVKKGDVLGYFGSYAEQIAQRDYFQSLLEEAERRLKAETALSQARIESAEIHQKQILEVSPLRIAAQEATLASLEAKLANDQDIYDSNQQLYSRGVTSRRLQEDQKSAMLQDQANVSSARARLSELKSQFEVDKVDAEAQVQAAQAQRDRALADIPGASLRQQVALAQARAHRATLFAPIDGQILNIRVKPGEDAGTGPVLTMGNTDRMRAVAEVYETDISRVRIGQPATVSSLALSRPVSGKVSQIGHMIFKNDVLNVDPAARADARVVEVWVDLDDTELTRSLTNLTVNVVINPDGGLSLAKTDRP